MVGVDGFQLIKALSRIKGPWILSLYNCPCLTSTSISTLLYFGTRLQLPWRWIHAWVPLLSSGRRRKADEGMGGRVEVGVPYSEQTIEIYGIWAMFQAAQSSIECTMLFYIYKTLWSAYLLSWIPPDLTTNSWVTTDLMICNYMTPKFTTLM